MHYWYLGLNLKMWYLTTIGHNEWAFFLRTPHSLGINLHVKHEPKVIMNLNTCIS